MFPVDRRLCGGQDDIDKIESRSSQTHRAFYPSLGWAVPVTVGLSQVSALLHSAPPLPPGSLTDTAVARGSWEGRCVGGGVCQGVAEPKQDGRGKGCCTGAFTVGPTQQAAALLMIFSLQPVPEGALDRAAADADSACPSYCKYRDYCKSGC